MDFADRERKCQEYLDALEEERRKIQFFQKDLPLCLQLVTQTIEICRQQMENEMFPGRSECEVETSSHGPVLEEFMPLKPNSSSSEEHDNHHHLNPGNDTKQQQHQESSEKKPDWLRSVQLWNQDANPPPHKEDLPRKPIAVDAKKGGGAFHPFYREKRAPEVATSVVAAASSTAETGRGSGGDGGDGGVATMGNGGEGKDGQSHRKARRCWSPELHRRFLHALQQLGGSHVATPKQIRELMKVDGLTNDEVKSHLQKYRLHTRRPCSAVQANGGSAQAPQFVLVGGIWVPPPEYAAAAAAAAAAQPVTERTGGLPSGIYAPKASLPSEMKRRPHQHLPEQSQGSPNGPLHSQERVSHEEHSLADDEATNSISSTTSSSSHATTTSPATDI